MEIDFDDDEAFKKLQIRLEQRDNQHEELKRKLSQLKENEEFTFDKKK